jgi:hypothetical protein
LHDVGTALSDAPDVRCLNLWASTAVDDLQASDCAAIFIGSTNLLAEIRVADLPVDEHQFDATDLFLHPVFENCLIKILNAEIKASAVFRSQGPTEPKLNDSSEVGIFEYPYRLPPDGDAYP